MEDLRGGLGDAWAEPLSEKVRELVRLSGRKVVVLDDDPTGTQTVYAIPFLTDWSEELLESELNAYPPAVYILTNSRAMTDYPLSRPPLSSTAGCVGPILPSSALWALTPIAKENAGPPRRH